MARPNSIGLNYFPFDIDLFDDEKIIAISGEFGIKGEISVIKLLCAIYRNGYYVLWNDLLKFKLLTTLPGISSELLENIVSRLVRWGFFDKSLFDSTRILTSIGIQKRYFSATKRRKISGSLPYLLIDARNNPVNVDNNPKNVDNNAQIKEKKILIHTTTTNACAREDENSFFDDMRSNEQWLELMRMRFRLSLPDLLSWIDSFRLECECKGTTHNTYKDTTQHFFDWLRIQLRQNKKQENGNSENSTRTATRANAAARIVARLAAEDDARTGRLQKS